MMERHRRHWVCKLHLEAPLHLGTGTETAHGAAVERDRRGLPCIRASSLAGVLTATAARCAQVMFPHPDPCMDPRRGRDRDCRCAVCALFGSRGQASRLYITDARLPNGSPAPVEGRDHVGIDRKRGTARERILYSMEVVPRNAIFEFGLRLDGECEQNLQLLEAALELWERGWVEVGGRSGEGLGRFHLQVVERRQVDLGDPEQLIGFITKRETRPAPPVNPAPRQPTQPSAGAGAPFARLRLYLRIRPLSPFLVSTGFCPTPLEEPVVGLNDEELPPERRDVDANFVETFDSGGDLAPYLPGSSLRGALRSHCERIVRTLGAPACDPHLRREQDCSGELQACAEKEGVENATTSADVERQHCLVCRLFGSSALGGRVKVSDALRNDGDGFRRGLKLLDHVAISRFTGGASHEAQFSSRPFYPVPGQESEGDLCATVDILEPQGWDVGLLAFALRDMHRGRVRLGYGKQKGFGKARIMLDGIELLAAPDSEWLEWFPARGEALAFAPFEHRALRIEELAETDAFLCAADSPAGQLFHYHALGLADALRECRDLKGTVGAQ
jgi:CRISPR/Cas system CSM-associated protein Csm3 (group 7 of RAMP superfamily)